jgi:heterodisulfide reductase subunit A
VRDAGVVYRRGKPSEIYRKNGKFIIRTEDTVLGKAVEIPTDLVVLSTGLVARADTRDVGQLLKISQSPDGFFLEAHPKLRPVDTSSDGVYIAGCCQAPKDIPDTVAQAKGAAASAIVPMAQGKVKIEPITSSIDEELCAGCRVCEGLCEYKALLFDDEKGVMRVQEVLCKGCGSCGAACPTGAISMRHFTDLQLISQIKALIQ